MLAWLQWWLAASSKPRSHICDLFYLFRMHSVKLLNGPSLRFLILLYFQWRNHEIIRQNAMEASRKESNFACLLNNYTRHNNKQRKKYINSIENYIFNHFLLCWIVIIISLSLSIMILIYFLLHFNGPINNSAAPLLFKPQLSLSWFSIGWDTS